MEQVLRGRIELIDSDLAGTTFRVSVPGEPGTETSETPPLLQELGVVAIEN